jgi:Ca2+/Na+ antiporter
MVALTTLLVMYTLFQSISNTLPKTAYLKLIDYWLLFSLILPFVIFMFHMVREVNKAKRNKNLEIRPTWIGSRTQAMVRKSDLQKSKAYVQFFIPLVTALFIVVYWIYVMNVYYNN